MNRPPKYGRKVDRNHANIRDELRTMGFTVADMSQIGSGHPDLLVGGYHREQDETVSVYVEVKMPGESLTEAEMEWFATWGEMLTCIVATCVNDVLVEGFGWRKEDL